MEISREGWDKYFDENNHRYYWFNKVSGVSEWADADEDLPEGLLSKDKILKPLISKKKLKKGNKIKTSTIERNANETEAVEDAADADLLESYSLEKQVYQDSEPDFLCYKRFIYVNAIFYEAPMLFIEIPIRILFLILCILFSSSLSLALFSKEWLIYTLNLFREILIAVFVFVSLIFLPCAICYIYKQYETDNDWLLSPIPTLIGWVDPRRFVSLVIFGHAKTAVNAEIKHSLDSFGGSIRCAPQQFSVRFLLHPTTQTRNDAVTVSYDNDL
jgi:hypothetical protein